MSFLPAIPQCCRPRRHGGAVMLWFVLASVAAGGVGDAQYVSFDPTGEGFELAAPGRAATLLVDPADWPGVTRAVRDLQADVERVAAVRPRIEGELTASAGGVVVIIGSIERSDLIRELMRRGKLDVSGVGGGWEVWLRQVVEQPVPGIDRALVIAGSDKRGTIYGIYDLSAQIGVSPWYWWADVAPERHETINVAPKRFVQRPPSVKYRGIFLNDEAPDLTNWVRAKFGDAPVSRDPPVPPGVANYGSEFYRRIFEVLLRLRANYLWPAMWANAFNEDDPANARLADEYGIVMGTSHQEPMLRAQKEWDRRHLSTIGPWNYARHPELLQAFWREGIRRNRTFESIVTLGLRGANDTEMAPGGPAANRRLLEEIVHVQRSILRDEVKRDPATIPQLWCLYKEVQDYYEDGMRVPDDVTLLWAEDNWGNVRRLPTRDEVRRSGGAGIYYHFDYHGGPRSYQWLNTNPLPKIWEQMSLAKQYGADRIWIVNAGHFKGYEVPVEFFLDYAWDTDRWTGDNLQEFLTAWATREFGPVHAVEIGEIVAAYAKFNGRRKPELLAPTTYSQTNYNESATVVAEFRSLAQRAERLFAALPAEKRDAFYQLVLFPTKASALVNELYDAAGRNQLYARQGRASAALAAAETRRLFQADLEMMHHFNHEFAGGRWAHFMDQPHLGYTTWRDPPQNSLAAIPLVDPPIPGGALLGVAVEVDATGWPRSDVSEPARPALPRFDPINRQQHWIDVFRRGTDGFEFTVAANARWLVVADRAGEDAPDVGRAPRRLDADQRLWVRIDWAKAPAHAEIGTVRVSGAGTEVVIDVPIRRPAGLTRAELQGHVENAGVVSIEPEHFTANRPGAAGRWSLVRDYGRTLSGMRADAPAHAGSATPGADAPVLEYRFFSFDHGPAEVVAITSPTLNFLPGRALQFAVAIDDGTPQTVTLVPAGYRAENRNLDWERTVADNARYAPSRHVLSRPGYHTLRIWMIDPGVVLQKLVIDLGGLKPSYLGPPENLWRPVR